MKNLIANFEKNNDIWNTAQNRVEKHLKLKNKAATKRKNKNQKTKQANIVEESDTEEIDFIPLKNNKNRKKPLNTKVSTGGHNGDEAEQSQPKGLHHHQGQQEQPEQPGSGVGEVDTGYEHLAVSADVGPAVTTVLTPATAAATEAAAPKQSISSIASFDVQVSTLPIYDKNIPAKHRKAIELLPGKELEKFNEYMEKVKKIPLKDFLEATDSSKGEIVTETKIVSSNLTMLPYYKKSMSYAKAVTSKIEKNSCEKSAPVKKPQQ